MALAARLGPLTAVRAHCNKVPRQLQAMQPPLQWTLWYTFARAQPRPLCCPHQPPASLLLAKMDGQGNIVFNPNAAAHHKAAAMLVGNGPLVKASRPTSAVESKRLDTSKPPRALVLVPKRPEGYRVVHNLAADDWRPFSNAKVRESMLQSAKTFYLGRKYAGNAAQPGADAAALAAHAAEEEAMLGSPSYARASGSAARRVAESAAELPGAARAPWLSDNWVPEPSPRRSTAAGGTTTRPKKVRAF